MLNSCLSRVYYFYKMSRPNLILRISMYTQTLQLFAIHLAGSASNYRRFYGKIFDNQLPVHFLLFLQASVNISGIRHSAVANGMRCFWSYNPSTFKRDFRVLSVKILPYILISKARFHVTVRTHINKSVVYFIVRRNVKFGCSEC